MKDYDVFLSYKHSDNTGNLTPDFSIAQEIYGLLKKKNISVFFSDQSIMESGLSDYKKIIDNALDKSTILVVISTDAKHLSSGWVEYEYETFYEDILSGRKPNGQIVSYTKNIERFNFPRTLARFQVYSIAEISMDDFVNCVLRLLEQSSAHMSTIIAEDNGKSKSQTGEYQRSFQRSYYSSDYRNELDRLKIQADTTSASDHRVLDYLFSQNPWSEDEELCVLDLGCAYGYVAADRFAANPRVSKILCIDNNNKVIERAQIIYANEPKMIFEILDIESQSFEANLREIMLKHNIDKIHIVFSALTLHHLRDPNRMIRKLRRIMSEDSYIIIRGSDDGSKLCNPGAELLKAIIQKTAEAPNASDRFNGRKIYTQLASYGFKDIRIFSTLDDTSAYSYDERAILFQESFGYRANVFRAAAENAPDDIQAQENLQWMEDALEEFENYFFDSNFWFCQYDYTGIARK